MDADDPMGSPPLDLYMQMAAFSGLLAMREYRARFPEVPPAEAVVTLRTQFYDTAHFDYDAALGLDAIVPDISLSPTPLALREILACLLDRAAPWWLRLVPLGRERVLSVLTDDQVQCFSAAGLITDPPDGEVVAWWDKLSQKVRQDQERSRLAVGRLGEQLTLEFEATRLRSLGISKIPKWVAIDNNSLGYDVLSYSFGPVEPVNRLIEVKATSAYPLKFHITRNEWDTALAARSSYVFHIWHLPTSTLYVLSPQDLEPFIPIDQKCGRWESTLVTLETRGDYLGGHGAESEN